MDMVKFCRLCLDIIYDDDFSPVEIYLSQILENLFMKVNLEVSGDPVMCQKCTTNLQDFYDFKLKCLSTENIILPFKDAYKNSTIDETYSKENIDIVINNILENQKICRFCMKCIKYEFTQLNDTKKNIYIVSMLQKHIPELNLNVAEEPIACKSCFDSLQSFHCFVTKCIDVEDKLTKYAESEGTDVNGHIQLNKVAEFTCNGNAVREKGIYDEYVKEESNCIKTENLLGDDEDMSIKTEDIDIKMELTDNDRRDTATSPQRDIPMYMCQKYSFTIKSKWNLTPHNQIHESLSKLAIYKCGICLYKTGFKNVMKQHLLGHKDSSQLEMFSCKLCTYRSKIQSDLKDHIMDIHLNLKENTHKCDICSYAVKNILHFNQHMLLHKNPSKVTLHKCTECTFATMFKKHLRRHSISIHKKPDLVFKCHNCPYKSEKFGYLKRHMSVHNRERRVPSERTLECQECSYKTTNKMSFQKHLIVHNQPELTIYKCGDCAFLSKYKKSVKLHMTTHHGV